MAVVRVIQIGSKAQSSSTPSSSWLAFWAITESAVAVIVGCGPGLFFTMKEMHTSRKGTYGTSGGTPRYGYASDGYKRQPSLGKKSPATELTSYGSRLDDGPEQDRVMDYSRTDGTSSQEQLTDATGIHVKNTVEVDSLEVTSDTQNFSRHAYKGGW